MLQTSISILIFKLSKAPEKKIQKGCVGEPENKFVSTKTNEDNMNYFLNKKRSSLSVVLRIKPKFLIASPITGTKKRNKSLALAKYAELD
jgi:hypothetical protein